MILDDLSQAIGNTPLLRLSRFAPDCPAELLAKLELLNPYSVKDRPALFMIKEAEATGALAPGGTIVEATSGNTGMGLAMACAARGYTCVLVMSELQSVERRQVLRALGAELVLTPAEGGTRTAREEAKKIARDRGGLYIGQHDHPANPKAHEETTAEELWRDTEGRIDALVAGLGTAGTLMGVTRGIRKYSPDFRAFGVEPTNAPFISSGDWSPHRIMGTAPGFRPGVLEDELLEEILLVSEEDAFAACRKIARTEGLLVGISSGATALAAQRLAEREAWKGKTIVCIFADSGQRYLSVADLWDTGTAELGA